VREEIVKIPNHIFGKFFFTKKKKMSQARPTHSGLGLQGWPQPSRVGWADVPAHQPRDWLLC